MNDEVCEYKVWYFCQNGCGKTANSRSGIWKHMKKCNIVPKPTKKKKKIYQLTDSKVQCTLCEIHCSTLQNVYIMPIHI